MTELDKNELKQKFKELLQVKRTNKSVKINSKPNRHMDDVKIKDANNKNGNNKDVFLKIDINKLTTNI